LSNGYTIGEYHNAKLRSVTNSQKPKLDYEAEQKIADEGK
jgi:hypothetical protein